MNLDTAGALAIVAVVCVVVAAWGLWLSRGSAARGAEWGYTTLGVWRPFPWAIGVVGVVLLVLADPVWVGVAVLYVAVMTWWLTRSVRRKMQVVRDTYGGFDDPPHR